MLTDLRLAVRTLRRGRAITAFAVLAFALGIGITTAVFSLFYGVLIKPLPFAKPDELVIVYDTQPACATCPASFTKHLDWKTRNTVFTDMAGSSTGFVVVTGVGDPERVAMARATFSLPGVFGVAPLIGRWYGEAEDRPGGPKVVVLGHAYWTSRFGSDPAIAGRRMTIDGEAHEILGVMPASFAHRRAEMFLPVQRAADPTQRGNHFLMTYARLKPGVTAERAQREMVALGTMLAAEFGHNHGIDVQPYAQVVVGNVAQPLRILMGAVSLVLLIACANVANLLLAAGLARRRELAVRIALGATRWSLARQLTSESVVLALAGGALGLLLAQWALRTFVTMADTILPRAATIQMDGIVLGFAAAVSLLTGVLCGLWPVVRINPRTLARDVHEGALRTGAGAGSRRFGSGLVIVEVALAFCLLVGAGLLVKNLLGLEARETGLRPARVITFDLAPSGARYASQDAVRAFYRDLAPRLAAVPGVADVGLTSHLPMHQFGWNGEVTLESGNPWLPKEAPLIERAWVGADYFKALGIDIVRGRMFDGRDRQGASAVTIISARTAEKFWPGQDPIGRRFARGGSFGGRNPITEVVGVARDVRTFGLASNSPYLMYLPIEQEPFTALTVVLRAAAGDPASLIPAARQVVAAMDASLPLARVQSMDEVVALSVRQPRLVSLLTVLFGTLAGVLAAVGVYGVMAFNVRRERREFGIRLALGADPSAVRGLVVRRGLVLGGIGVGIGALAALLLTRTLTAIVSEVQTSDPVIFTLAGAGLLAVTLLAGYLPARQASKTDPMVVLRTE